MTNEVGDIGNKVSIVGTELPLYGVLNQCRSSVQPAKLFLLATSHQRSAISSIRFQVSSS